MPATVQRVQCSSNDLYKRRMTNRLRMTVEWAGNQLEQVRARRCSSVKPCPKGSSESESSWVAWSFFPSLSSLASAFQSSSTKPTWRPSAYRTLHTHATVSGYVDISIFFDLLLLLPEKVPTQYWAISVKFDVFGNYNLASQFSITERFIHSLAGLLFRWGPKRLRTNILDVQCQQCQNKAISPAYCFYWFPICNTYLWNCAMSWMCAD